VRIVTSGERLNDFDQELRSSDRNDQESTVSIVKVDVGFPFVAKVTLD
jgi:hypothetical protein